MSASCSLKRQMYYVEETYLKPEIIHYPNKPEPLLTILSTISIDRLRIPIKQILSDE